MKQRVFAGTEIGEVGLGCWQFGGDWGAVTEEDARATLQAAVDGGVNFFDTADVYGSGVSEEIIGRYLADTRADVFVATKLGRRGDPGWPGNFTSAAIRSHTEDSLRRLGVEQLDLTQLHCIPTDELRKGDVFETLRDLQAEGKIAHWGASVESVEEGEICLAQSGLASLQIIFNIFRQKPIDALLADAKAKGVGIIVRLPLASGLLTGKFTAETTFAPQDHRNYNRDGQAFNIGETFAGLPFELGVALADELKPLVPSDITLTQMALRWCLDFEAVSVIIPGAKDPAQAKANVAVSDLPPLSSELHAHLREWYTERVAAHIRGPY